MELIRGSGVYLEPYRLQHLQLKGKDARHMVRLLLIELIGEEDLKTMSATGKGGWARIPSEILAAIECK